MADDYAKLFRNESNPYIWLSLSVLKKDYVSIEIVDYPMAGHSTYAFWVAGDGERTFLYFTTGLAYVLNNKLFRVKRVYGAADTMIVGGRIKYMMERESPWEDLGPIERSARLPEDPNVNSIRRVYMKDPVEEGEQLKDALKSDFWSDGGKF